VPPDDSWSHLHRRPLKGREEVVWYLVATVTYVAASLIERSLLNWLVGPVWLVTVVSVGPVAVDRIVRRRR
jgi:hypothetical protein